MKDPMPKQIAKNAKFRVLCTPEQSDIVLEIFESHGIMWAGGDRPTSWRVNQYSDLSAICISRNRIFFEEWPLTDADVKQEISFDQFVDEYSKK